VLLGLPNSPNKPIRCGGLIGAYTQERLGEVKQLSSSLNSQLEACLSASGAYRSQINLDARRRRIGVSLSPLVPRLKAGVGARGGLEF
jgi:hypothetical protein